MHHEHDKIFRKILDDKCEAVQFINKTLKLENKYKIKAEDIEKYNCHFVTKELKDQESDIIYKLKKQNVFILIEHQTKIDYTMPLRILEYEIDIIKSTINEKLLNKKEYKYPMIIPIVLYTGRKKWNANTYLKEAQENLKGYDGIEIARYNIVDVNDYTEEELLKDKSFISKAMLIEKTRYTSNIVEYLDRIIQEINQNEEIYTKSQKELLVTIISIVLGTKIEESKREKMIKNLEGGDETMLAVVEALEEENRMLLAKGERIGERKGKREGAKEIAKKMLEENADIDFIARVTGLKKEQIMRL